MIKKFVWLFSVVVFWPATAQLVNQGHLVMVGNYMVINNLDVHNNGTIDHRDGVIIFRGNNWDNDGTMVLQDPPTAAETRFAGNGTQTLTGDNANVFNHLVIDAQDAVTQENEVLTNSMTVNDNGAAYDYRVADPAASGLLLTVKNDLTLNGNLRLYDDSQLLQEADNAVAGSGKLLRDQMGTGNKYWYNFWCAPVNNGGTWKVAYLLDGRDPDNPQAVQFVNVYSGDGSADVNSSQTPAYLNEAWIWKFENRTAGDYDSWEFVGKDGLLNPGVGYTMKGPDIRNASRPGGSGNTEFKSWTFAGTPNNGTINLTISGWSHYLIGNPYPSALDANAFINDNPGTTGSLYFWEHVNGDSHYLEDYTGGYAVYNSSGGVAAKDWQTESTTVGTKTPGQYIPVGQGFFVGREDDGDATITLQNSQRVFEKEDGSNSVFMRMNLTDIRLYFDDPAGFRRHLLLAVRPGTTLGYDWSYDGSAWVGRIYHADMFFRIDTTDYVIQAIGELNRDLRLPLHVIMAEEGEVRFGVEGLQNIPAGTELYLEDTEMNQSHRIDLNQAYTTVLPRGDYPDRFVLAFRPGNDLKNDNVTLHEVSTHYNGGYVYVENPNRWHIDRVTLFDMSGKTIWEHQADTNESHFRLKADLPAGVYLVKIQSGTRATTVKILVE